MNMFRYLPVKLNVNLFKSTILVFWEIGLVLKQNNVLLCRTTLHSFLYWLFLSWFNKGKKIPVNHVKDLELFCVYLLCSFIRREISPPSLYP